MSATGIADGDPNKAAAVHTHAEADVTSLVGDLAAKAASSHAHAQSDTTGLVAALAAKAASSHTHAEADVTSLVADLAAKAASSHTHAESDVTALVADLAGKVATSRLVSAGNGLTGGGALTADVTLAASYGAAIPPVPNALGTAGAATSLSRSDHRHAGNGWSAADHGLIAQNFPNYACGASQVLSSAGLLHVWKIPVPYDSSVTNVILTVGSVGVTLTSGQCFAALWNGAGTLLGVTADQSVAWTSAGVKVTPLVGGPFAVTAGYVYVGAWYNGTTSPGFSRAGSAPSGLANVGLSGSANLFYATADASLTTTAPGTLGTRTASSNMFWAAIS